MGWAARRACFSLPTLGVPADMEAVFHARAGRMRGMKPRFSIRLLLLLVALCAVCVSWRMAAKREQIANQGVTRGQMQKQITYLEDQLAKCKESLVEVPEENVSHHETMHK